MSGQPRPALPDVDAILTVELGEPGALGRSRVRVALRAGEASLAEREVRIHGSGPQRLRRAAFAALNEVRRAVSKYETGPPAGGPVRNSKGRLTAWT